MQTYQDAAGAWVAVLNGRVSGGHTTEDAAKTAVIGAEIYALGSQDVDGNYTPADVETVRAWALSYVRSEAAAREDEIDKFIAGNPTRMAYLFLEVYDYILHNPNPTNPAAGRYALANALAQRRGATLKNTLDALQAKFVGGRNTIAGIITEFDRLQDALNAPGITVAEIEAVLAGISWG